MSSSVAHTLVPLPYKQEVPHPPAQHSISTMNELVMEGKVSYILFKTSLPCFQLDALSGSLSVCLLLGKPHGGCMLQQPIGWQCKECPLCHLFSMASVAMCCCGEGLIW